MRFARRTPFLKRHAVLTIRNLTASGVRLGWSMNIVRIQRSIREASTGTGSVTRRSIRQFGGEFLAKESDIEFAIEALIFGVLVAASAWPMVAAAGAINQLL